MATQSSTEHVKGLTRDIWKEIIKYIIPDQSEERSALLGSSFDSPGAMETSVNVVLINHLSDGDQEIRKVVKQWKAGLHKSIAGVLREWPMFNRDPTLAE